MDRHSKTACTKRVVRCGSFWPYGPRHGYVVRVLCSAEMIEKDEEKNRCAGRLCSTIITKTVWKSVHFGLDSGLTIQRVGNVKNRIEKERIEACFVCLISSR